MTEAHGTPLRYDNEVYTAVSSFGLPRPLNKEVGEGSGSLATTSRDSLIPHAGLYSLLPAPRLPPCVWIR
jgi:hypothetical protein